MNFVLRTIPRHMSEDVPLDTAIDIDFLVDLDAQKLNDQMIFLFDLTEEKNIPISFEYRNKHLKIVPKELLKPNNHYQIELLGGEDGIVDIIGRYQEKTYQSEFYTSDIKQIKPPVILAPTDTTEVSSPVTFRWQPVDQAAYYIMEISQSNTFDYVLWPIDNTPIYETEITPNVSYVKGNYYVRIAAVDWNGVQSDFSEPVQFYVSPSILTEEDFIIQTNTQVKETTTELEALQMHFYAEAQDSTSSFAISSSKPANQTLNLPVSNIKNIVITFNDTIDSETVQSNTCYVVEEKN